MYLLGADTQLARESTLDNGYKNHKNEKQVREYVGVGRTH